MIPMMVFEEQFSSCISPFRHCSIQYKVLICLVLPRSWNSEALHLTALPHWRVSVNNFGEKNCTWHKRSKQTLSVSKFFCGFSCVWSHAEASVMRSHWEFNAIQNVINHLSLFHLSFITWFSMLVCIYRHEGALELGFGRFRVLFSLRTAQSYM